MGQRAQHCVFLQTRSLQLRPFAVPGGPCDTKRRGMRATRPRETHENTARFSAFAHLSTPAFLSWVGALPFSTRVGLVGLQRPTSTPRLLERCARGGGQIASDTASDGRIRGGLGHGHRGSALSRCGAQDGCPRGIGAVRGSANVLCTMASLTGQRLPWPSWTLRSSWTPAARVR